MEDISSKMFYQHHFIYGRFIEDVSAKAFNQRMSHRRRFIYRRFIKDIYNQRTFHRIHLIKGRFIEDVQSTDVTSTTLHRRTFHRRMFNRQRSIDGCYIDDVTGHFISLNRTFYQHWENVSGDQWSSNWTLGFNFMYVKVK
jgi:hypothetical protein